MAARASRLVHPVPNLRHLALFDSVVRRGSVSAAARAAHLSQPAVTQAVAHIETALGARLLERSYAGLALTGTGKAAAQRVEHYEIAAYGTATCLARQIGEVDSARLLSYTLGEEESADFLLSAISEPLMQQESLDDAGAAVNLETVGENGHKRSSVSSKRTAAKGVKTAEEAVRR